MRHVFKIKIKDGFRYLTTPLPIQETDVKVFSVLAHEEQGQTYGDKPYSVHLEDIHQRLLKREYTLPENLSNDPFFSELIHSLILKLSFTHDIIEDTKYEEIDLRVFSKILAQATEHLSDVTIGVNRKERKRLTNLKHSKLDPKSSIAELIALIVKPVDRLSNWETAFHSKNKKLIKMYRKEYPAFRQAVHRKGINDNTWKKLDDLFIEAQPKNA